MFFAGYYEVNTEVVRETMKIIKPPITDISTIGTYIAKECQDRPIYMLEKNTSNGGEWFIKNLRKRKIDCDNSCTKTSELFDKQINGNIFCFVSVIKRSVNKDQIFVHYAGKKFYEIDIMNMDEIE